jgi:hypothetical protein
MEKFTLLLFFKSIVLFFAIVLTISMIDKTIRNILDYNRLSSPDIIPIAGSLITLTFWYVFYILSNL